ncbi:MAG TPA: peptidylprolyl isomerase [Syntrophales bacterium]|nr:peptidylprolyl isomerase [Syntrophales bacterium]HPI57522.1 peptidylprolyl isomerase [Syntrophales bacterium]HPN24679.1 peptidylprolyl isomerase [Syntrophales bacterium]HQM29810.1 peptidylprolyl isomerase [Syntrophales bacterium]
MSRTIREGDAISVHYTGRLESGEIFDSSQGRSPLSFTVGSGQLVRGFDHAVMGMAVGDKKTVTILPADAYGERKEDLFVDLRKKYIPEGMDLEVGMVVELSDGGDNRVPAFVQEIHDEFVRMDLNHYLAGKILVFDIEIVSIV